MGQEKSTQNANHCFGYSSPSHLFQLGWMGSSEAEAQRETSISSDDISPYHVLFCPDLRNKYHIIETNFPSQIPLWSCLTPEQHMSKGRNLFLPHGALGPF